MQKAHRTIPTHQSAIDEKRLRFFPACPIYGRIYAKIDFGGQAQIVPARLVCPKSAAGGGSQWREAFILTIDRRNPLRYILPVSYRGGS